MYLFSLILGVLLLPEVSASDLVCYQCAQKNCMTQAPCPANAGRCASMAMVAYAGSLKSIETYSKGCVAPQQCIDGSINFGLYRVVVDVNCCSSSLCNNQDASIGEVSFTENGKKCYYCEGQDCTKTLSCLGDEDHCFSLTTSAGGIEAKLKGCASKQICSALDTPIVASFGHDFECCQGDLCNSAI